MNQQVTTRHALGYVAIALATALLGSLGQQLTAGAVPIPKDWAWLTPVLLTGVVSLSMLLPRIQSGSTDGSTSKPDVAPTVPAPDPAPMKGQAVATATEVSGPPPGKAPAPNPAPSFVPENLSATAPAAMPTEPAHIYMPVR